jgi:hypothetical protein
MTITVDAESSSVGIVLDIVLADCCASYFPELHDFGLRMIKAQGGIFGWVSGSQQSLNALRGKS